MYDSILFPTDGSEGANAVFDHVLEIAQNHGATVHILNVADTTQDSVTRIGGEVVDVLEREGEEIVEKATARADERGVPTVTEVLQGGVPETIRAYADEYAMDLIAMPTHGRSGLTQMFLGSVTERVIGQASVPVLALNPDREAVHYPYRHVLVPTDGSECAAAALDRAVAIAKAAGATLHVLSVVDIPSTGIDASAEFRIDALREAASEVIEDATATAEQASVDPVVKRIEVAGSVSRAIGSYVEETDVDLVVMGTRGRTGLGEYLLGSTTERTVRTTAVPVLTVPEPRADTST